MRLMDLLECLAGPSVSQMNSQPGAFATYRDRQNQLFDAWRNMLRDRSGNGVEQTRILRNPSSELAPDHMGRPVTPQTFVEQAKTEASPRAKNPTAFNKEQEDFRALLTVKVPELIDIGYTNGARAGQPDSGLEIPAVRPMRIFLGGLGGCWQVGVY